MSSLSQIEQLSSFARSAKLRCERKFKLDLRDPIPLKCLPFTLEYMARTRFAERLYEVRLFDAKKEGVIEFVWPKKGPQNDPK